MTLELTLQPMTAIEAVNTMLASIGQGAINTLESSESVDAENAKTELVNTSRTFQTKGWWFNTEHAYVLVPDAVTGEIALPSNCMEFNPREDWRHLVDRGGKLYDTRNRTFVFDAGTQVTADLVVLLAFESLPQTARDHIAYRAGRSFQATQVGSELLYKFTKEKEQETLVEVERAHLRARKPNALLDNPSTYRISRYRRG